MSGKCGSSLRAEFVPKLRVGSFHKSDSEGCTIVTIERHSSDRLSAGPSYMHIYARSARSGLAPLGSSCCTESIIVFTPPTRTAPFRASAEVLRHPFTTSVNAEAANSIDVRLIYVSPRLVLLSAVEISSTGLP